MASLVAIGYPDEVTASSAAEDVRRRAADFGIEPDCIAVVHRDREGKLLVTTSHHPVGTGSNWGMFWGFLFGLLFFVPVFGMSVGTGLGALLGKVEKAGIEGQFQDQARDMLQPGTSALFLVLETATPGDVIDALHRYDGTVLTSPLSKRAEAELQKELHGAPAPVGSPS